VVELVELQLVEVFVQVLLVEEVLVVIVHQDMGQVHYKEQHKV
jgi:hypothetical protein